MYCRVIPYEGKEPYIFLSYCHKDAARVYPIMEQMAQHGCRIWYDDGNHPGDDWLENIAQHLNDCSICLAMISENSAASHNCRNELSFAVECQKTLLAVLLEEFPMPLGMRMQLGTIQHLKYGEYSSITAMLEKLYEARSLAECKASSPDGLLREAAHEQKQERIDPTDLQNLNDDAKHRVDSFVSEEQPAESHSHEAKDQNEINSKGKASSARKKKIVVVKREKKQAQNDSTEEDIKDSDKPNQGTSSTADIHLEQDVPETENQKVESEEETPTVRAEDNLRVVLLHPATGACYLLNSALIRVGRSERRCDVVISDNQSLSNHHADIIRYNGRCYLRDAGSANGTFVNDDRLPAEGRVVLNEIDTFRLYNEAFQIVYGDAAVELLTLDKTISLTNKRNGQTRVLIQQKTTLGRDKTITQGLFEDPKVSRNHADVFWRDNIPYLYDRDSTNGTYLNGNSLTKETEYVLNDGDTIQIGDTSLEVHIITLRGEER